MFLKGLFSSLSSAGKFSSTVHCTLLPVVAVVVYRRFRLLHWFAEDLCSCNTSMSWFIDIEDSGGVRPLVQGSV